MTRTFLRPTLAVLVYASALAFASPSLAAMVNFKAELKASNEVPPPKLPQEIPQYYGTGKVTATYDTATRKLTWKGSYCCLTGPATAAHFHGPAPAGKNAGIMVPINLRGFSFSGSTTLNEAQANALMAGQIYVNIHTAANKAGEIRGQLMTK